MHLKIVNVCWMMPLRTKVGSGLYDLEKYHEVNSFLAISQNHKGL